MNNEARRRHFSEDYADLLISYKGDLGILEQFENATIHIIDSFNAVVHVPVEEITNDIIFRLGYSVMPSLYGLISRASLEASGIFRLRNVPNLICVDRYV